MKRVFSILFTLTLAVSLVLMPAVATNAAEPESESGLLPPSIIPVVILQGSDYEMGYQYGQQSVEHFGQYIEISRDSTWASALGKYSYDEVLHQLKAGQYFVRKHAPEQIEIMEGIADGATDAGCPLSYLDVLMLNGCQQTPKEDYPYPPEAEEEELLGCSSWAVWGSTTTDGGLIGAGSCDVSFGYQVTVMAFPDDGNSYIVVTSPCRLAGCCSAMNNKGVFWGNTGGAGTRSIDRGYGIPYGLEAQHVVRFADSAEEALNMWLSVEVAGKENLIFADVTGDAYVLEASAAFKAVREPGDFGETDFVYAANNHFTDEGGVASAGEEFVEHAGWLGRSATISSQGRNLEMWNMFHNYQGEVDLDFAKMIWRYPGDPPPYPMGSYYGEYWESQGVGWNQQICNLNSARVGICVPDDGNKGVMYICTGPAGRVAYPLAPEDSDWYQIEGTHTFYKLALASKPSRVLSAAYWITVEDYIREAYHELMWLNPTDTGYAGLNELYSTANAEFYEGVNWRTKAKSASGNEQLLYYSKALTAFTRAQAHANQVLHALVPPATCPSDLGLGEYLGPWAEWATRADKFVIDDKEPGETTVELTTEVLAGVVSINVGPTSIDFGELMVGATSETEWLTVENTGNLDVSVTATATSTFYTQALWLNNDLVDDWGTDIVSESSDNVAAKVNVPSNWVAGTETGLLIFWAEVD